MQDPGWKEAAQRRASQFLTLITPRQRSDSDSESDNAKTEMESGLHSSGRNEDHSQAEDGGVETRPASPDGPNESAQRNKAESQRSSPPRSPEPDHTVENFRSAGREESHVHAENTHSPVPAKFQKRFSCSSSSRQINHMENLTFTAEADHLTESQTDAFRTVFQHFDRNHADCIDAGTLSSTLESVGISITSGEVQAALKRADYDEDGVVGFHDFLSVMTDCQQFSKCMKVEGTDRVDVSEKVFYKTLTELLNAGVLPRRAAQNIIQYYHKKTLRLIGQTARLGYAGGHVLTYYSRGAHLLGLTCKQLRKYLKPLDTNLGTSYSPYLQHPSLKGGLAHTHMPPHHGLLMLEGRVKTTKTWKTVEIEDQIRKLSIKHPGMKTKEMITPVQIRMNLAPGEQDHLTFDQLEQIVSKSQWALDQYLKTLSQYKRRDSWSSWGSLQSYCRRHRCKHFPQTFSTYSWSWSSCSNTVDVSELLHSKESPSPGPHPPQQRAASLPEDHQTRRKTQDMKRSRKLTPASPGGSKPS